MSAGFVSQKNELHVVPQSHNIPNLLLCLTLPQNHLILNISNKRVTMKLAHMYAMLNVSLQQWSTIINTTHSFGGLGVACWPLVPKFAGSNPAEAVGFLRGKKILSTPSFGGEVKPSVPCRRFAACKRSLNVAWRSTFRQNYRTTFSPTVPASAARISRVVAEVEAPGGESGNV